MHRVILSLTFNISVTYPKDMNIKFQDSDGREPTVTNSKSCPF